MSIEMGKLKSILEHGDFYSDVSEIATLALQSSIDLKNSHKEFHIKKEQVVELDFSIVNRVAIEKRGNLKVYQNLPKGIRVVAR